jgi:hypothetical protein
MPSLYAPSLHGPVRELEFPASCCIDSCPTNSWEVTLIFVANILQRSLNTSHYPADMGVQYLFPNLPESVALPPISYKSRSYPRLQRCHPLSILLLACVALCTAISAIMSTLHLHQPRPIQRSPCLTILYTMHCNSTTYLRDWILRIWKCGPIIPLWRRWQRAVNAPAMPSNW